MLPQLGPHTSHSQVLRRVRTSGGVLVVTQPGPELDALCAAVSAITDTDGLALVMDALRRHQSGAVVRKMACWLLAMLCRSAGLTATITTAGAPELALAALTHKDADAYGRFTASLLLSSIANRSSLTPHFYHMLTSSVR